MSKKRAEASHLRKRITLFRVLLHKVVQIGEIDLSPELIQFELMQQVRRMKHQIREEQQRSREEEST